MIGKSKKAWALVMLKELAERAEQGEVPLPFPLPSPPNLQFLYRPLLPHAHSTWHNQVL